MKVLAYILVLLLVLLQAQLWFGQYGALRLWSMKRQVAEQQEQNDILRQRNESLHAEVIELKSGLEALEERARSTLGMIKEGEEFYQTVPAREPKPVVGPVVGPEVGSEVGSELGPGAGAEPEGDAGADPLP